MARLSENVGKSIYYKNRRYIWSYDRYSIKIADIYQGILHLSLECSTLILV